MDTTLLLGIVLAVAVAVASSLYVWPRPWTVSEFERGLRFRGGRLVGEVGPGRYWLRPRVDELVKLDMRTRQLVVSGQEVLTADHVPIKVSLIAEYRVTDATRAWIEVEAYQATLYGRLQLALRQVVAGKDLDGALAERGEIGQEILGAVGAGAADLGLEVRAVDVRDFMMAGGLRSAYTDVIEARQRGLAALERARGESAALRSLANSAELLERHPGLAHLRLLQAVEAGSGNRIVIALDPDRGRRSTLEVTAEEDG